MRIFSSRDLVECGSIDKHRHKLHPAMEPSPRGLFFTQCTALIAVSTSVPPIVSCRSNDDLALRKQFFSDASERESEEDKGPKIKLTATEVLMLCWERGLLRTQHWPDAHLRWKEAGGGRAGGVAAAVASVEKPIPEAEAQAMLSR